MRFFILLEKEFVLYVIKQHKTIFYSCFDLNSSMISSISRFMFSSCLEDEVLRYLQVVLQNTLCKHRAVP